MAKNLFRLFGAAALLVSLSACVGPGGHRGHGYGQHRGHAQPQAFSTYRGGFVGAPRSGFQGHRRGFDVHPGN